MGKHKTKIDKIKNTKIRHLTFYKRKKGLLKKAMELNAMCDVNVLLCIFNTNMKKCAEYTTLPFAHLVQVHDSMKSCDICVFSPKSSLYFKVLCTDEDKGLRSAELLTKLSDNKIKVFGESTTHSRSKANKKSKQGIARAADADLTDNKNGQQTYKFCFEETKDKDTDNKLLYKDNSCNSESPQQQTKNLIESKNSILKKNREQFEIKDCEIEEDKLIDEDSSSASRSLESSYESYTNSIPEQQNLKDHKNNKAILHESITFECEPSTKVKRKLANLRSKQSKQEISNNLKSDIDHLKSLADDKKHFERDSKIKSSSFKKNSQKWIGHSETCLPYKCEANISDSDGCLEKASISSLIKLSKIENDRFNLAANNCAYNKVFKVEHNCDKVENKRESKLKRKLSELQSDRCIQAEPSEELINTQQPNLSANVYHPQHDKDYERSMLIFGNEHQNNRFEISRDANLFKFADDAYMHGPDCIDEKLFIPDHELFNSKCPDDLCHLKLLHHQPYCLASNQMQADLLENKSISELSSPQLSRDASPKLMSKYF